MIKIIDICRRLDEFLKSDSAISDYRIALRGNENLYVYLNPIKTLDINDLEAVMTSRIHEIYELAEVEIIDTEDIQYGYLKELFEGQSKIDISRGNQRFDSILNNNIVNIPSTCVPAAVFYSYKGGMGRSTTLAAFALWVAIHKKLKVAILDLDIEAPGFTNFYLKNPDTPIYREGIVEYLFDKNCGLTDKSTLGMYSYGVDRTITGDGEIRIFPAGNLDYSRIENNFLESNLRHYIHALARLDIAGGENSLGMFSSLISDINDYCHPNIILVDSRTGINDIFGIGITRMANLAVGFFRNDVQTYPGLAYFLYEISRKKDNTSMVLVNSILPFVPSDKAKLLSIFKEKVNSLAENICPEDDDYKLPIYPIGFDQILERVGRPDAVLDDFVGLVKKNENKDLETLFQALYGVLYPVTPEYSDGEDILVNGLDEDSDDSLNDLPEENENIWTPLGIAQINLLNEEEERSRRLSTNKEILNRFHNVINEIDLYADDIPDIYQDFENQKFFLRECMKDLLNFDKYVILGSKGTGKSYLYKALIEPRLVKIIQEYSHKDGEYIFIEAVNKRHTIFSVAKLGLNEDDEYKYRFWMLYTWQIIIKNIQKIAPDFKYNLFLVKTDFKDDTSTKEWIEKIISDTNLFIEVEREFNRLDSYLSKNLNFSLTILYDQLDEMVEPSLWNEWIPSLIKIWRNQRYKSIFGKLFLRKDLFRTLVGITNIKDVENKAIDIEWTPEEMYSFLLQSIFSKKGYAPLWEAMYFHDKDWLGLIKQCRRRYRKGEKRPWLDDAYLKHLIETLFGKDMKVNDRPFNMTAYNWFYENLKNADNTISVRPFISLMKIALTNWKNGKFRDKETLDPVLAPEYYTDKQARSGAVEAYYEDLVRNERGAQPIEYVFDYLKKIPQNASKELLKYKRITLYYDVFQELIRNVILLYKEKDGMKECTPEILEGILINNGLIARNNTINGIIYRFSFLYKYTLGLKGR